MKTAHRCAVAISPTLWRRYAIPPLGCCGGPAIPTLRRLAAGWLPSQRKHWLSSVLNSKTEWPWVVGVYGAYDLLAQWQHDQLARPRDQFTEVWLGKSPMESKQLFYEASPLTYTTIDHN